MDLNDDLVREELKSQIEDFVDAEIRPLLHGDGGDCQIVDLYPTGILRVMLHGACSTCPSSIMTLKFGVERRLMEEFPEIKGLELAGIVPAVTSSSGDGVAQQGHPGIVFPIEGTIDFDEPTSCDDSPDGDYNGSTT